MTYLGHNFLRFSQSNPCKTTRWRNPPRQRWNTRPALKVAQKDWADVSPTSGLPTGSFPRVPRVKTVLRTKARGITSVFLKWKQNGNLCVSQDCVSNRKKLLKTILSYYSLVILLNLVFVFLSNFAYATAIIVAACKAARQWSLSTYLPYWLGFCTLC